MSSAGFNQSGGPAAHPYHPFPPRLNPIGEFNHAEWPAGWDHNRASWMHDRGLTPAHATHFQDVRQHYNHDLSTYAAHATSDGSYPEVVNTNFGHGVVAAAPTIGGRGTFVDRDLSSMSPETAVGTPAGNQYYAGPGPQSFGDWNAPESYSSPHQQGSSPMQSYSSPSQRSERGMFPMSPLGSPPQNQNQSHRNPWSPGASSTSSGGNPFYLENATQGNPFGPPLHHPQGNHPHQSSQAPNPASQPGQPYNSATHYWHNGAWVPR